MDQQQPEVPAYQPPAESNTISQPAAKNKRKLLALWLLIGPTALLIGSIILFAIVNFILTSTIPATGEMSGGQLAIRSILNIITLLVGVVSFMAWLPGIIIGIVLLTTQKKA